MAVVSNTTTTAQITTAVKEIDFVSRFNSTWESLRAIMGISRPIKKQEGTRLQASIAEVTLQSGLVPEGDEVPLTQATVSPVYYEDITMEKHRTRVTAESVEKFGAVIASQKTDDAFLNKLTGKILTNFYSFAQTGTLGTDKTYDSFQMAVSMAVTLVKDKFKKLHLDHSNIVAFVNTIDVGEYLGTAPITVQSQYGMEYLKDFLGASVVIITSDIPRGKVLATPAGNINFYYIDPASSELAQIGLNYTTVGEGSLIGVHKEGVYSHVSGDTHVIMGVKLFAEYLDGIANVSIAQE